jgi:hypothetical protein
MPKDSLHVGPNEKSVGEKIEGRRVTNAIAHHSAAITFFK